MPYSPTHNYVHVAIPKTGTTSLIRALKLLHERDGGEIRLYQETVTPEFRARHGLDELGDRHPGRTKHLSAIQLKTILGAERFDECFSFSIVRNPFARLISRYFFTHVRNEPSEEAKKRKQTGRDFHDLSFPEWMERRWKRGQGRGKHRTQLSKLTDPDGRLLVDYVGRLETFQDSFDEICRHLGVETLAIPHVNGTKKSHYSDYYDSRTRDMAYEMCSVDIDYFGFEFDDR